MKSKILLLVAFIFVSLGSIAQTADYSDYLKSARKHLSSGNCEKAQLHYNVYKEMTGKRDKKLEIELEECRPNEFGDSQDYVDLGLPSGTLWKKYDEQGFYSVEEAKGKYFNLLPSYDQMIELFNKCKSVKFSDDGVTFTGNNGATLFMRTGYRDCTGSIRKLKVFGYWCSACKAGCVYSFKFNDKETGDDIEFGEMDCIGLHLHLVKK